MRRSVRDASIHSPYIDSPTHCPSCHCCTPCTHAGHLLTHCCCHVITCGRLLIRCCCCYCFCCCASHLTAASYGAPKMSAMKTTGPAPTPVPRPMGPPAAAAPQAMGMGPGMYGGAPQTMGYPGGAMPGAYPGAMPGGYPSAAGGYPSAPGGYPSAAGGYPGGYPGAMPAGYPPAMPGAGPCLPLSCSVFASTARSHGILLVDCTRCGVIATCTSRCMCVCALPPRTGVHGCDCTFDTAGGMYGAAPGMGSYGGMPQPGYGMPAAPAPGYGYPARGPASSQGWPAPF